VDAFVLFDLASDLFVALKTLEGWGAGGDFVTLDTVGITVQALVSSRQRARRNLCADLCTRRQQQRQYKQTAKPDTCAPHMRFALVSHPDAARIDHHFPGRKSDLHVPL